MITIERMILKNLLQNEDYLRAVIPYLKEEYFLDKSEQLYFKGIYEHFFKFDNIPNLAVMDIYFQSLKIDENTFKNLQNISSEIKSKLDVTDPQDWILSQTEQFCKDKALYLALNQAIVISQDENENNQLSKTAIPDILSTALAVSFDNDIGHDYVKDTDKRFQYYNRKLHKFPCHLDSLNKITNGGVEYKTVNCIISGTGVGKTMFLCDLAANYIKLGNNVLYITLEMAEEKIASRIDANLMNISLSDIDKTDVAIWKEKVESLKKRCVGSLVIKEYPTGTASVNHFRFLLRELKMKKSFIPDILIVDYMNLCSSAKFKDKSNSYGYIKSICEELRGLAGEAKAVLWTATQANRSGNNNSDIDITNTSESMGGPMTFDMLLALIANEQLNELNQVMVKQLKNRYSDLFQDNSFALGVDRNKMKFYDLQSGSGVSTNSANKVVTSTLSKTATTNSKTRFSGVKV